MGWNNNIDQLGGALRRCYALVRVCQDCGYLRSLLVGPRMAEELRAVEKEIDMFIRLIPLIALVDTTHSNGVMVRVFLNSQDVPHFLGMVL
jgi:hypothetical protein